jgi:hypothetical protein
MDALVREAGPTTFERPFHARHFYQSLFASRLAP